MTVPSVEEVQYGRRVLLGEVERLRKFEAQALDEAKPSAEKWGHIANWIEFRILGPGEGCVITAFDARWLDPKFRKMFEDAFPH